MFSLAHRQLGLSTLPRNDYRVNTSLFVRFWERSVSLLFFAHRALAACKALSLRSSGVMVTRLAFPPILPPLRPIADITREISALLALGGLFCGFSGSGSAVDRCTIWKAAWFTSEGLVLIRFGMAPVCHVRRQSQNSK